MRAARTDANHGEIVQAYRDHGWRVLSLARLGDGAPDLLVADQAEQLHLVEVKTPKGRMRPQQEYFTAQGWFVRVVRSVDDVRRHCAGFP